MHVPLHALVYGGDKIDSRSKHTRGTDIDSLANSIGRLGLILPLAVIRDGEKYRVVDGNRRLEALKKIHKGDKNPPEVPVLVQETANGQAKMMSLAANVERLPLHPVDQYECFAALADGGLPIDEIAASLGISERQVRQQMALGSLAPQVRQYYREGKIDIRLAKSLTRLGIDEQLELVGDGNFSAWQVQQQINEMLRTDSISASSGLAHFVTREAYSAAGGSFVQDLFIEEADEAWADPQLANRLAEARIEELRKQAEADGWSFFEHYDGDWWGSAFMEEEPAGEPSGLDESQQAAAATIEGRMNEIDLELDRQDDDLHPKHNELVGEYQDLEEKLNEILDSHRTWTAEQKARLGVVLSANWEIHEGCARRKGAEPQPAVEAAVADLPPPSAPGNVIMELDAHLTVACKAALAADPALALRLLALQLLEKSSLFGLVPTYGGITINQLGGESVLKQPDHRLDEVEGLLKAAKLSRAKNFEDRVKAMERISDDGIRLILAFFTARSLAGQHRGRDLVLLLDKRKQLNTAEHFTPDVDNFFGRLTKAQLVMVLDDMGLSKKYKANNWDTLKKAELAAMVAQAKPEGWLPEAMRPKKPE